ncbi:LemA family protein [Aestuariispira insulae]|uniref:LemA protein n=1 Tax=Aestuariispira insulae TaxID=1461337 RepID=A0A3D9HY07_9PROT|nr:LemA family protein [Aestuariispira insulae]RED54388.1 LemA protein [Aestuariispira insulae]
MMSGLGLVFGIIVLGGIAALLAVIFLYNKLVSLRQRVLEGWSGIDVQLKRRSNLVPNLIAAVKGYMAHEKGLLEDITKLRAQCVEADTGPKDRQAIEGEMSTALIRLFAVAENYPDLKADSTFLELQQALGELEDQIQMARRYYNGTVRNLNILIESFPANLLAQRFGFVAADYYEVEHAAERAVPQVDFKGGE